MIPPPPRSTLSPYPTLFRSSNLLVDTCPADHVQALLGRTGHPDCRVPRDLAIPRHTPHPYLAHQPYIVPQRASARTAYLPTCWSTHAPPHPAQPLPARPGPP